MMIPNALQIVESGWNGVIPKPIFVEWMDDEDIEVLGAVELIISGKAVTIAPPLQLTEINSFLGRYYERCIREGPQGECAASRYMAANELKNWFLDLWDLNPRPDDLLVDWKLWFEQLYCNGDECIKRAIVD